MLVQAILIGLIAMFVTFEWMFGTNLGSRPIITGMLVGLVMGDLKTGIILGATLEMVFIGSITLGAAVPPDVITGGILGAAFAISTGKGADVALALAFPIATLYLVVDNVLTLGVDQHIIIWHFRRIKLCRNNAGIFHPRTPGILVITVIEKIITVITRLKMGYFNFPDSANYGIK